MSSKHIHYPDTTPQQRKLLFETWQTGSSVVEACRKAHVGRGTFYRWKPRFEAEGYAGLEEYQKKGPEKGYGRTSAEIEDQVIKLRKLHADWGKHRIADEIAKANNWVPLISPNTVRRILEEAGLWKPEEKRPKKALSNP
jgi:transposase